MPIDPARNLRKWLEADYEHLSVPVGLRYEGARMALAAAAWAVAEGAKEGRDAQTVLKELLASVKRL